MEWRTEQYTRSAVVGFAALIMVNSAFAAPPTGRVQIRPQSQIQTLGQHLDLRAPTHGLDAAENGQEKTFGSVSSMAHRLGLRSEAPVQLPALGQDGMRSRPGIQDFVRRVHQEGLPVARLLETKSALVHLGLSPKGKPGLWLVQKIH
jgi:hypothetical protein